MNGEKTDSDKFVDLHIHSIFSDGDYSVEELLEKAYLHGVNTLSITDHDNVDGSVIALRKAAEYGVEVIPGTELSCEYNGVDIHILGYFIDVECSALKKKLAEMKISRLDRARKMVKNLNNIGIDLRFETVHKLAGDGAIGRPHIAKAMLKEELIYSFKEAFEKYLYSGSPVYEEKMQILPKDGFELILGAGGIPVIAHPGVTKVDELIPQFVKDGLKGIEVFHPEQNHTLKRYYREIAKKYNLIVTGGSDFHTDIQTRAELGFPRLPYSIVDDLKNKCYEIHGSRSCVN